VRGGRTGRSARLLGWILAGTLAPAVRADAAADPGSATRHAEAYHLYSLGQQSLLERDYLHAVEFLERAAARDASPGLLLELAQLRYALNDLDRALGLAHKVLADAPADARAHRLLGDILLSRARDGGDPEASVARAIEAYRAALRIDPGDEEACRSLAELYYHTGRLEESGALLRDFQRGRPLDAALLLLLGKVDVRTGRFREAEEILGGIVARAPGNLEAADALAALYEHQQKYDEAIALYEGLLRGGAGSAYLRDRIGSLHLEAGRYREAIRELEEGQRLDPADSRGLLVLGRAYEGAGESEAAEARYDQLIRREPGHLEARLHRGRLLQKEGRFEEAEAGFREILDLASGRGALTEREAAVLALAHSQIGLIAMAGRDYAAAAGAFGRALDASGDPGPELFLLLGRATLEEGRADEAQRIAAEASRRHPGDLDLRIFQGEVLIARGDPPGARRLFDALLETEKRSPDAYGRVAEALLRQKRFEEAEGLLREGMRRHPSEDALCFARGAALERLGRIGEAERLLSRAIRLNPKNAMALNYLGYMLADRGLKLREALGYVERALKIDPRNGAYLDSVGWAQFKLGLYGPAERSLREAVRHEPSDPTIREHLGDLLLATGRGEEALREWEAALQRGHDEPERVRDKIARTRSALKVGR
jgi:tetratricopeptide (TPR) repeat protein